MLIPESKGPSGWLIGGTIVGALALIGLGSYFGIIRPQQYKPAPTPTPVPTAVQVIVKLRRF